MTLLNKKPATSKRTVLSRAIRECRWDLKQRPLDDEARAPPLCCLAAETLNMIQKEIARVSC